MYFFQISLKTFVDLSFSILGCATNINFLRKNGKNYWNKGQITVSISVVLDTTGSIFNTLIAYQEKLTRTGNIPKEVAELKESARGRFNLHS